MSSSLTNLAKQSCNDDNNDDSDHDDDDTVDEDKNDPYLSLIQFQSIRNEHGLETAISVQYPGMTSPLRISTLLEPDDLAPLFAGAQWAGTRVWPAAIRAIQYLVDNHHVSTNPCKDSTLLELGCGLGVPGMVLHSMFGCQVYLTDQESIMSQVRHNVETNFPSKEDNNESPTIQALPLSWSQQGVTRLLSETGHLSSGYDVVLNCDCIYEPLYGDSWKLLVTVMEELFRRNPNTVMVTSVERRTADGIDTFLATLEASPHVSYVERVVQDDNHPIEIYLAHGRVVERNEHTP